MSWLRRLLGRAEEPTSTDEARFDEAWLRAEIEQRVAAEGWTTDGMTLVRLR